MQEPLDLIVVGAGIVGLAHAYAGAQRGLRVAVIERDTRCVGASIRNFGFITVTGQAEGDTWRRARRSRDVWAHVAPLARIDVVHHGLWVLAQRPEAMAVLEQFAGTAMGAECELCGADAAESFAPALRTDSACGALYSPHELRVESRTAIPRLAAWLAEVHGVQFHVAQAVLDVAPTTEGVVVRTSRQMLRAERVVICPGADLTGIAWPALAEHAPALSLCKLHMLRVRPDPGLRLGAAVMSDLSLVRYLGYAAQPAAAALGRRLETEAAASLAHGIHLIAVQSADGTLVVGDSHHYAPLGEDTPDPFAPNEVDALILAHLREAVRVDRCEVVERWTGVYPSHETEPCLMQAPHAAVRMVTVTSGTGASTAFALAEEVFDRW